MKTRSKTAYEAAIALLNRRAQSEWELRTKLRRKEYSKSEIDETVAKLYEYRYLNDEELAEDIFNYYREERLYGDRYIHMKLKSRGLSIDQHLTGEEEIGKAEEALRNKEKVVPGLSQNYRRAAAFLFRRGFSPGTVSQVMQNAGTDADFFEE